MPFGRTVLTFLPPKCFQTMLSQDDLNINYPKNFQRLFSRRNFAGQEALQFQKSPEKSHFTPAFADMFEAVLSIL